MPQRTRQRGPVQPGHRMRPRFPPGSKTLSTSSLPRFFAAAGPHRLAVLRALWPAITGDALANHSEVVGIQGDVMRVRADSGSWLKTLRDLKGTLVFRLQRSAGPLAPRALAFVEGPLAPRPPRRKPRKRLTPVPVSALPKVVSEAAKQVPTTEGREVYLRAATAFQARFGTLPESQEKAGG